MGFRAYVMNLAGDILDVEYGISMKFPRCPDGRRSVCCQGKENTELDALKELGS